MIDKPKIYEKDVLKTLNKLVKNFSALDSVNITKKSTSHYSFDAQEQSINDRIDVQIDLGAKIIDCQVIFDSTDYNFPPDILFRKPFSLSDTFEANELSALLPNTWDINNENCLRDWFSHLISLVKKPKLRALSPPPPETILRKRPAFSDNYYNEKQYIIDDDYNDFSFNVDDKGKHREDDNTVPKGKHTANETRIFKETNIAKDREEKQDQRRKRDGLFERGAKPKETIGIADDDAFDYSIPLYKDKKQKRSNRSKETGTKSDESSESAPPVKTRKLVHGSSSSKVDVNAKYVPPVRKTKISSKQSNSKNLEWRKEFMTAWLKKFQHHILQYDAEDSRSFSLYLAFDISEQSSLWHEFNRLKHNKLVQFNTYNERKVKLCKAKSYAPMICHFHMDADFPTSKLNIKMISVMNTIDVGSAEPDCLDISYEIDLTKNISFLIQDICKYLSEQAIPFHLQMKE